MNNIERYFGLIVFAMYVREVGPKDYNQTFKQWMDDHNDLREMIAEGRSKLEWERKIPDDKLVDPKDMLDSKDFKTNLPRSSRGSTNSLGHSSVIFQGVTIRITPCTNWPQKL